MKEMNAGHAATERPKSQFLKKFLILFSAALIVLGIVLGTAGILSNARSYARYGGTIADRATYSYLASNYKFNFMRSISDTDKDEDGFFDKKPAGSEKTYGELLEEGTKEYIIRVLVSVALFDQNATATEKQAAKEAAKKATAEVLTYRTGGDKKAFDQMTAAYGYTFSDLESIALLLYKASMAQSLFYGAGGINVTERLEDCNTYLSENYSAVYLFMIRTESTFIYNRDENGQAVIELDGSGFYATRPLRDEERTKRNELIARIDSAIGQSGSIALPLFKDEMKKYYDVAPEGSDTLYYLSDSAAYTQSFNEANGEEILATAKELEAGTCKKVTFTHGVCYVYKADVEENAFGVTDYETFFSDFYQNAADFMFAEDVKTLIGDVTFKARSASISFTAIPYKDIIRVRF